MTAFTGKVVLITGGAHGIGAEVARRLHARGANLVLVDLDLPPLQELAEELGGDEHVVAVPGDVRDLSAMVEAVAKGVQRFGGIDIVVANAGIGSYGSILAVDPTAFRRVIEVNLIGCFHTLRAALPSVIERRGYVLLVSSVAAYVAMPGMAAYNASKAGVEHLANTLRAEVAHLGVDVGSAHMTWIDTPLVQETLADLPPFARALAVLPRPFRKTMSVQECAARFERGIERRARRINVPAWAGALRWVRPLLHTPLAERVGGRNATTVLPEVDAEVARLGRSLSARTQALGDD
ncbi:SDR family oxidoreductase [Prescottella agglutinans]|uniref:NAD(P)-dependent dehydrogenase (Short-subunit alcohol dehydrogenase family) n=1 Tax=Prescottella agglutinans TaxID=1644129 RepID=A0ABT6MAW3_9NOCA|nr:SDR family oxidoreductase [Prescottella agglutinans]MDH6280539.1 NAD(P)-dependent dehydrogenase (short-subunit alcohol dehydrogenase family) [Prescottella agglutinans]